MRKPPTSPGAGLRRMAAVAVLAACCASSADCAAAARRLPLMLSPDEWKQELRKRGVEPASTPDPLRFTPEMQRVAIEATGRGTEIERLRSLQSYLFEEARFPFDYSSRETYTAEQAFVRRRGNCVSFTVLFIALARSVGLPVRGALLTTSDDVEKEGELVIVNSHIVAVFEDGGSTSVFDFYASRDRSPLRVHPVGDLRITAIYLVNMGAGELIEGNLDRAADYLETAVKLAPGLAVAYGNLGVVRRRQGDIDGAFAAYRQAIEIDPEEPTVLHNLAALYRSIGREDEARAAVSTAAGVGRPSYILLIRGDFEFHDGNYRGALKLYRQAMHRAPTLADARVAIARAQHELGHDDAARRALQKALKLDPTHAAALRLLDKLGPAQP